VSEPTGKVVLITADSLRADAATPSGALTSIARLGAEGVVFENAFATGSDTTQSFPGILGSNYPTTGGTVQSFGDRHSVAECFQAAGFETAAFHSNPLLSRRSGYGRGFGTFWDSLPSASGGAGERAGGPGVVGRLSRTVARRSPALFRLARRAYRGAARRLRPIEQPHEPAEVINERAMEWLESAPERFFLWLHYMDPHWPYAARLESLSPQERREALRLSELALRRPERLTEADTARLKDYYAMEVGYLDGCLGRLFDFMEAKGIWGEAAVVLTSDHGQAFGDHGTSFHGDLLYDELLRVPLAVKLPGGGPAVESGLASLIDLAPTLCQAAGLEPSPTFEGRPLTAGPRPQAVFAETAYRMFVSDSPKRAAVRTAEWKLIRDAEAGTDELYRVADDPGERRDVSATEREALERMGRLLDEHIRRERPTIGSRPGAEPPSEAEDEALRDRLRALGYMD
jgi:arylsulfatase A-like enzyme